MNPFQLLLLLASTTTAFVIPMNQQLGSKRSTTTARNVVGKDHFDMEELRKRIMKEESTNPYQELFRTDEWEKRPKPDMVNIILFKPDTAEEGVHTIEYPKGSGSNVILAFESMKECGAFAAMLKAQQFFDPTVCLSASSFVRTYDYDVMFIYLPVKLQLHLSKKCHSVNHPTHTHSYLLSLTRLLSPKNAIWKVSNRTARNWESLFRSSPVEWKCSHPRQTSKNWDTTQSSRMRKVSSIISLR